MTDKIEVKALISEDLRKELDYWGYSPTDILTESLEYIMWATVRRKTDNLCRECKKPIEQSIPRQKRITNSYPEGFCSCKSK
ncbi:MAG: hypothetical protein ABIH11_06470 [Candidatus Altiarchaeota archaeon]